MFLADIATNKYKVYQLDFMEHSYKPMLEVESLFHYLKSKETFGLNSKITVEDP
jgi:hypothetical protein